VFEKMPISQALQQKDYTTSEVTRGNQPILVKLFCRTAVTVCIGIETRVETLLSCREV